MTSKDRQKDPERAAAGRKGGQTTRDRYGAEHFSKIGRMGGSKGGSTTRDRHGAEHYQRIGAMGGAASHSRTTAEETKP